MMLKKILELQKLSATSIFKKQGERNAFQLAGFKFQHFGHLGR